MSETTPKELTLDDINEMLRKPQEEIQAKEHSIKSLEKSLANAKNRLAVLKGREGTLKLDAMKKKYGVQSVDELMQRMDDVLGEKKTSLPSSASHEPVKVTKETKDSKEKTAGKVSSTSASTTEEKKEEGVADYSKML